jgi:thiol:disulfide interchange protein DsbA
MIRRLLAALAFAGVAFAPLPAAAQQPLPFLEISPPLGTQGSGKLEVVEFFWYECGHCYAFEPYLEAWLKKLPKDVEFRRVPAMWNNQLVVSARVFYALEALGEVDRLHRPLYDAIHRSGLKITNQRQFHEWLERQKVDVAKFSAASRSFAVESRLKRALETWQASKADGVPTMMVNGRYLVTASLARGEERMLLVVDSLIEQSRKQVTTSAAPKK